MTPVGKRDPVLRRPICIWMTGLSAAGKSTLAAHLKQEFKVRGVSCCVLDGDLVRQGLNRDLGFSAADRTESVRRVGEVASLMVDAGLVVIASLISPFRADRLAVRERFAPDAFVEVFVDTPIEICEARDPKGLYRRARRGELHDFTGISSDYEPPEWPELRLIHDGSAPETGAAHVMAYLETCGCLASRRGA